MHHHLDPNDIQLKTTFRIDYGTKDCGNAKLLSKSDEFPDSCFLSRNSLYIEISDRNTTIILSEDSVYSTNENDFIVRRR